MSAYLQAKVVRSRGLCVLSSIGKSVLNRDLWLVTVGDATVPYYPDPESPSTAYPKPKFAYIGGMHGDEIGNVQLLLQFLEEVCTAPREARLQALVDSTVLYIVPCMNPDGYVQLTRLNANYKDLNRNAYSSAFPYARPTTRDATIRNGYGTPLHPEAAWFLTAGGAAMEPETVAVTSWLAAVRPTVSADLHGGALVASYALDACDSKGSINDCPSVEAPLPNLLANAYSMNHKGMRVQLDDTYGDGDFVNGTTEGASWYTALGTLQDWAHHVQHLHMITLEVHSDKQPFGRQLAVLYSLNRDSLLRLAEMAHLGLKARVVDAVSRAPLLAHVELLEPKGMWPPEVEADGLIWKVAVPNMRYSGTLTPVDPGNPDARYPPISFNFTLAASWDEVVSGTGLQGLSAVYTMRARQARRK
ncbi:Carboxypeptidase M [Tetrabaena socialis]|uniref:Carboxypeptidase M n=1 Tax=Tetrabaena socialis TaxID=47790 RepID=A0A2J7ZZG4_9CHLO|nr:Carboxypeptidase M [Tetrabaena socialis]|eukprot:PNH05638.1 Carboxypeptidase M [Tetrabaena socialis]